MFMKVPSSLLLIIILVFLSSCAKRGTPDGGPLDENPPEIVKEIPKNNSIYFSDEKIRIFFDEYIKLEKLNSQLVVSPPIDKSKYSIFPQGGASKYIDIEINDNNDYIVIRLADNGTGIQDIKKAMTPYYTTKKKGTGLGLPIVNKIINEHSGEILIKNNNGTLIEITLPKY